jgi:hypothetical protein
MKRFDRPAWTILGAAAIAGAAFLAGRALAGGIPATGALSYSGTLEDATGAPMTGSPNLQVDFWGAASGGTTPLCQTGPSATALDNGRFSVALPDTCTTAVKGNPNLWVEVFVNGNTLGRTKINAVPYAVEAGHATNADSAASATGTLATQISDIQGLQHPPSSFRAYLTTAGSLPNNSTTQVVFDHEDFDLAGEYNNATGEFKPNADGVYLFTCQLELVVSGAGHLAATVLKNGVDVGTTMLGTSLSAASPEETVILQLKKGDQILCAGFHDMGAPVPFYLLIAERNKFEGARLY